MQVKTRLRLLAALACVMTVFVGMAVPTAGAQVKFTDIRGHWAEQPILEMNAYDIVHGYPGGKFAPDSPVTFIEAVVMVLNTVGLGQEIGKVDTRGLTFHPEVTWGKEHLAVAVREGMITKEGVPYIYPGRSAYRYEVASMVYHALKLQPEPHLSFADILEIPEKFRSQVGAVARYGLMRGLPGNIFAPRGIVTRGQMCALLVRLIDDGWSDPPNSMERVVGYVTAVDGDNVALKNFAGLRSVKISADCPVGRNGATVDRSALAKENRVKIIADGQGTVRYACILAPYDTAVATDSGIVNALTPAQRGTYRLTLQSDRGGIAFYDVNADAKVVQDAKEADGSVIGADAYVKVSLDRNNRVFHIATFKLTKVSGTIVKLGAGSITLRYRGANHEYRLAGNIKVTRNVIREISYNDLKPGNWVDLWVAGDTVLQINLVAGTLTTSSGMVSKVYNDAIYIYVNNQEKRYNLSSQVEVYKDGDLVGTDQLKRGDFISFGVDNEQTVSYIEVINESEGEFEGTVTGLNISSRSISFEIAGGLEMDYGIASDARFYKSGDEINLSDIIPGARVRIIIKERKVTEIELLDDRNITISGRVKSYNPDARRVTIEINGYLRTYNLSGGAVVKNRQGQPVPVEELKGYTVEARLVNGAIAELTAR